MSLFAQTKKETFRASRVASQGTAITLVAGFEGWAALYDSASRVAEVLGEAGLQELGDGICEMIPFYFIPTESLYLTLQKLSTVYSVGLVEYKLSGDNGQFVLLWKVPALPKPKPEEINLDEY